MKKQLFIFAVAAVLSAVSCEKVRETYPAERPAPAEEAALFKQEGKAIQTATAYEREFHFKNICGVIELQLTGMGGEVTEIEFRAHGQSTSRKQVPEKLS